MPLRLVCDTAAVRLMPAVPRFPFAVEFVWKETVDTIGAETYLVDISRYACPRWRILLQPQACLLYYNRQEIAA